MAEEDEKRTPVFEWIDSESGEFYGEFKTDPQGKVVTVTETEAAQQIVVKAMQTARGVYLIYANVDEPELDHKYGNDSWDILTRRNLTEETRIDELKRAIREAVIYDPWVTDVTDIKVGRSPENLESDNPMEPKIGAAYASFMVHTIFDSNVEVQGVNLNG